MNVIPACLSIINLQSLKMEKFELKLISSLSTRIVGMILRCLVHCLVRKTSSGFDDIRGSTQRVSDYNNPIRNKHYRSRVYPKCFRFSSRSPKLSSLVSALTCYFLKQDTLFQIVVSIREKKGKCWGNLRWNSVHGGGGAGWGGGGE